MRRSIVTAAAAAVFQASCATTGSLQKDLDACNARFVQCGEDLADLKVDNDAGQEHLDWAIERLNAYKDIAQKLRGAFETGDLDIVIRRGRMVVQLPNDILLASGKVGLSSEGQENLRKLATVLKTMPRRRLVVAGHTDNVPVKKKDPTYESNWDLSVARGLRVVKFLIKQEVAPKQLSAAGYGEFLPLADNDTPEGRKSNRRIEIIVMPNVRELPEVPQRI